MTRRVAYLVLLLASLLLLGCMGVFVPIEVVFFLAAGWAFFLARVVPGITLDWGGVAIGGVCLVLFAGLAHSFFGWLYGQVEAEKGLKWKVRWTASLVAGVVLMFVAGISAAGIAHQTGWLLTSKEPWVDRGDRIAVSRAQSTNNLKQIGLALSNYQGALGSLPPGTSLDDQGQLLHGWQARILPYLEQQAVYDQIDFARPWDDPRNSAAYRTRIWPYLSPMIRVDPDGTDPAPSHYAGNAWVIGGDSARKLNEIPDGTSNTFLAGEAASEFKPWGHPNNVRDPSKGINRSPDGFGSPFPGGANFLFVDGSVHFLRNTVDPKVFRALGTPAGGETINSDAD
jgi:prepilin-type processing-associated H-X9-DG protein